MKFEKGEQPFSELGQISPFTLAKKVKEKFRPKFKKCVTDKMQQLISKCWGDSKSERPTFGEIFKELSNDFSYFDEKLDEKEIKEYLSQLDKSNDKRISKK